MKEDKRHVKSLNSIQVKKLLSASSLYKTMRLRILLALGTGLRRGDIEKLKISDIDTENSNITTNSKRTRKSMGSRPVPVLIIKELEKYLSGLDIAQGKIFADNFSYKKWMKIREKA